MTLFTSKYLRPLAVILLSAVLLMGCGNSDSASETTEEIATIPQTTAPLSPLEQEAERVIRLVQSQQTDNNFSFLAFADTHEDVENKEANQLAGEAAAMIRESVDIDFTALLGGVISEELPQFTDETSTAEVITGYLKEAFNGIPGFIAMGEHDCIAVRPDGTLSERYYFQDLSEHKTRVIVLDTSDTTAEDGIGMSARQLQWFAESLDLSGKADAKDWSILILSHVPLDFGNLLDTTGRILDAYITGTAVAFTQEEQSITYSFEEKNSPEIIANFHGHSHCLLANNLYLTDQSGAMYRSDLVRVCIPNAGSADTNRFGINETTDSNGIEFGERETYEKMPGTESATSFNVVTVDRENRVIHCINFGAGYDREIPYDAGLLSPFPSSGTPAPAGEYTNLVPASTEFGRRNNNIFNEIGYRNHTYLVCSDIDQEAWPYGNNAQYVTTGAIPFTVPSYLTPPTIYIWGAELDESDHTRFFIYDSQKYRLVLQATGAEFKNYFTIEELGDLYYKLTPIPEGKASVLFPATNGRAGKGSIAFSLKGTGENLVITTGEPILPE